MTLEDVRPRVAKGAAYLDRVIPNWFTRIDVGTLSMECGERCIAGQLAPGIHFGESCRALGFAESFAAGFGMDLTRNEWFRSRGLTGEQWLAAWRPLADAWIEAIAERRVRHDQPRSAPAVREDVVTPVVHSRRLLKSDQSRVRGFPEGAQGDPTASSMEVT